MLGAARIGAGLYEAREGAPIWPYHYHYPDGRRVKSDVVV